MFEFCLCLNLCFEVSINVNLAPSSSPPRNILNILEVFQENGLIRRIYGAQ